MVSSRQRGAGRPRDPFRRSMEIIHAGLLRGFDASFITASSGDMSASDSARSLPPVQISSDPKTRIVRLLFRGFVTSADVHAQIEIIRANIREAGPGFSLLTDLSELQEMEIDTVRDITRVLDLCLEAGVSQIVRVIPDPSKDIGFHLLSMTHYRGRVPIMTCETLAEAERILGVATK